MALDADLSAVRYRKAVACREGRNYLKAIKILGSLSRAEPEEPLFLWEIGYSFLDAAMPEPAIKYFQRHWKRTATAFQPGGASALHIWKLGNGTRPRRPLRKGFGYA